MDKSKKAQHIKKQKQTRFHCCHWPGCEKQVPPALWGCKVHWFKLPKFLRDMIWLNYVPGQEERLDPTEEYLRVADDVQKWIKNNYARP